MYSRWGPNYQSIIDLCDSMSSIPSVVRRGFGNTMANIVFYHSIPDNLPGVLWFQCPKWNALFSDRSMPKWLPALLDGSTSTQRHGSLSESLLTMLRLIKKGMRNQHSLARAMGLDVTVLRQILVRGRDSGLLTAGNRLTRAGSQSVWAEKQGSETDQFDRSLYVPSRWCVGRGIVQPSGPEGENHRDQTDSTNGSPFADGEVGQASLERTDAKTATPSVSVMSQKPSMPRKGHGTHGPKG
jgi:hypothetical protein